MSVPEALIGKEASWPSQKEQYEAQERFDNLRAKLEENPYAMGITDDIRPYSEDGVYISPGVFEPEDGEMLQFTEMRLMPGAFIGAGDTFHGVMFAQVEAADGDDISDVDVAIKPYSDKDELKWAINEHDTLLSLKDKGFDTLSPLAIFKDGDKGYLITRYRPDIESMDNVDWTISPDDERFEETVVPNLQFIARSMATMHASGIFRNDAATKNYVKNDSGGEVIIDIEHDSRIAETDEEVVEMISGSYEGDVNEESEAIKEIKNFWYFITRPWGINEENVLMAESEPEEIFRVLKDSFYPTYKQSLLENMPEHISSQVDIDEFDEVALGLLERTVKSAY